MKPLLLALAFLFYASPAFATTYYASTGGSGSTCSSGSPCSLTTGISTLAAGDTLILNDGTYTSPIDNVASGISDVARTTILAANARMAVITGVTANSYVLEIENKNYITIDGLVIDCSALNHDCATIGDSAAGLGGAGSTYVTFQNGEVKNSLTGSCMTNHNTSAPTVVNHHISILNSLIHDCGTTNPSFDGFDPHGVYAGFDNGLVEGNTIYNVGNSTQGGACIQQFGDSEALDSNIYRRNTIHDCQSQAVLIANGSDDLVYSNIVYSSELHDEGGGCVRLGAGSIRTLLYNNTVYGCQNLGIVVGSSTNSKVRNNISYANGGTAYTDGGSGTTHDHNLEDVNPSFTNATGHDFTLQAGSAAIDTGADLSATLTIDYVNVVRPQGSAFDIGAYEFVSGAVSTGPMASYNFNQSSGTTVTDTTGNGNTINLSSAGTSFVAGHVANGIQFNGSTGYGQIPTLSNFAHWTIELWVQSANAPTTASYSFPLHRNNNWQINWNHVNASCKGAAGVRVSGVFYCAAFGTLNANTWYYLTATYDGTTLKAYKDGILANSATPSPSGAADDESNAVAIGAAAALDSFFSGTVDDVKIYNRALTATEVLTDMGSPPGTAPPAIFNLFVSPVIQ